MIKQKNKNGEQYSIIDDNIYYFADKAVYRLDETKPSIIKNNGDLYWFKKNEENKIFLYHSIIFKDPDYVFETFNDFANEKSIYHRVDGPAFTVKYKNHLVSEQYFINDLLNREDGPAKKIFHTNHKIAEEGYFITGFYHREDGPAFIRYDEQGNIKEEEYYLNGTQYTKDVFENNFKI
jgi:hypothetical protein